MTKSYPKGRSKQDLIWSGTDCLQREVSLYKQERDHIITEHKVMNDNFHAIYECVTSADSIYASRDKDHREVYFKRSETPTYGEKFYTKTIVEFEDENTGFIVTAFPSKKEGGNVAAKIYDKNKL